MSRPNLGIRDRPISFAGESLPVRESQRTVDGTFVREADR